MNREQSSRLELFTPAHPSVPNATSIPLAHWNNRYAGQACHIIGRGVTDFDYCRLPEIDQPILFINDAVCLEPMARRETYFFAHDAQLQPWLDGALRSTAVLPLDGKFFTGSSPPKASFTGRVTFYQWDERGRGDILAMTRDQVAHSQKLFVHSGTIHSALHFAWYCGFTKASLIGCDGHSRLVAGHRRADFGLHDPRLENRSGAPPAGQYLLIRKAQDELIRHLGLDVQYIGTPQ